MRAVVVLLVFLAATFSAAVASAAEPTVEIPSRNQKIRAILLKPEQPVASVILLVGGHGQGFHAELFGDLDGYRLTALGRIRIRVALKEPVI